MTKQPPSDTTLRLSKVCRLILTLGTFKLLLLGSMFIFPEPQSPVIAVKESKSKQGSTAEKSFSKKVSNTLIESPLAYAETTITPPAPKVRQSPSPFTQDVESVEATPKSELVSTPQAPKVSKTTIRPDEATSASAPAPKINPFVPKDSVQRKQEELNRREQELLALQQQMQSRLDELRALEVKIQKMLDEANNVKDQKLTHLIDVYSNMKAKQAAEVLATLDARIAVKILAGMRGRQAGEVLTYMAPEPAAKLSELLSRTQLP